MGSPLLKDLRLRRTLARNLSRLLAKHGLSQKRLAQISRVNQKQVNNLRQQRTGCGIDALGHLAAALQVEPWELLVEKPPQPSEGLADG